LVNGDATGAHRVTSATLSLNGVSLASPSDLSSKAIGFDRSIMLQPSNALQVTVSEPSGGVFTISILGTKIPSVPTALMPNHLTITLGSSGTLTATLSPTPSAAGTLTVASANTAVATVPASISFASGQSTVPVPVAGVGAGTTQVAVSLNGGTASSTVQVN